MIDNTLATKPGSGLYVGVLTFTLLAAYLFHARDVGIFACEASAYDADRFLAYCNAESYTNYDQGAFWYRLEPEAYRMAREADVMFIGNSKLQFAMSTDETKSWFSQRAVSFYLFGFAESETVNYFAPVIGQMKPQARVFIVNADAIFEDRMTATMAIISTESNAELIFRTKKAWQGIHRLVCSSAPKLCGREAATYRYRKDGSWTLTGRGNSRPPQDVADGVPDDADSWPEYTRVAKSFLSQLPAPRECILLMLAPSTSTHRSEAEHVARELNIPLISPQLKGLQTFDMSHLDARSAARWSTAFLKEAEAPISRCLGQAVVDER